MINALELICNSLDELANSILNSSPENRTLTEFLGWHAPPLNRQNLVDVVKNISQRLREYDITEETEEIKKISEEIPKKILQFRSNTLPQLFSGNGVQASTVYFSLIVWITNELENALGWETIDANALPKQLTKKLRSIEAELNEITPDIQTLLEQIRIIQSATEAAISLPTDLENLKEARIKVEKFLTDSAELHGKIDIYSKEAEKNAQILKDKQEEASKIVAQCEEVYKITTTKGLAASFDLRAKKLTQTMWIWVVGLLLALAISGLIGASRFQILANMLNAAHPQLGIIWMDFILSIVGLAAPIWFAWLATKQINQLFRLAEDYAFKASVAKAYEGYRREAARIDESFEARLFSSALTRLEEAPLRLVETDFHGSPWQELFSSSAFQNALDTVPGFKDKFISIAKEGIDLFKPKQKIEDV